MSWVARRVLSYSSGRAPHTVHTNTPPHTLTLSPTSSSCSTIIKGVVFVSWWQGLAISIASS